MESIYQFVLISAIVAFIGVIIIAKLSKLKSNILFIGIFATIVGLLVGSLAYLPISNLPGIYGKWMPIGFYILSVTGAIWIFYNKKHIIEDTLNSLSKALHIILNLKSQFPQINQVSSRNKPTLKEILVDTSVLIDGRVSEIAKYGFIPGRITVPKFILSELQNIADSEDQMRRQKGRRGLDTLSELKKHLKVDVVNEDVLPDEPVDSKLIGLAKNRKADVLTTDYNLNKVAKIENVRVLNINELSQALRPMIIPGEEMDLKIVQAGKEKNQGVAYLPDGTMIVVEEGDRLVDKTVTVVIKRVLQTTAGKMYFATLKDGYRK
jgi:uncharacterized protein YacL